AAGHQQAARRPAQRRGIAALETRAGLGQGVDVGSERLGPVGAVAAEAVDAAVVGENEQDGRPLRRGRRRGEAGGGRQHTNQPTCEGMGFHRRVSWSLLGSVPLRGSCYRVQPLRYSRRTQGAASGQLLTWPAVASYSIFLPTRTATLPKSIASVSRPL